MITAAGVRAGMNPFYGPPPHGGIDGDPAPMNPAPTVDFILSDWHHILFYAPLLITATTVKKILL